MAEGKSGPGNNQTGQVYFYECHGCGTTDEGHAAGQEKERGMMFMAVLAECPRCHKKQSIKNKVCRGTRKQPCGDNLDKAKKNNTKTEKVRYWIAYRANGKQRREFVGYSVDEARDADGKRRVQKRENRIFEILPDATMTFNELAKWYLDLPSTKTDRDGEPMRAFHRKEIGLENFNKVFGNTVVGQIKLEDLEHYQSQWKKEGYAQSIIDQQINYAKAMIEKAFLNEKVGPQVLKAFKGLRGLYEKGSNARTRTLSIQEYLSLIKHAKPHLKPVIQTLMYTGMRLGEVLHLRWDRIKDGFIRLKAEDTKTREPRNIPISEPLMDVLNALPSSLTHRPCVSI